MDPWEYDDTLLPLFGDIGQQMGLDFYPLPFTPPSPIPSPAPAPAPMDYSELGPVPAPMASPPPSPSLALLSSPPRPARVSSAAAVKSPAYDLTSGFPKIEQHSCDGSCNDSCHYRQAEPWLALGVGEPLVNPSTEKDKAPGQARQVKRTNVMRAGPEKAHKGAKVSSDPVPASGRTPFSPTQANDRMQRLLELLS